MQGRYSGLILILFHLISLSAESRVVRVPGDHTTIQGAIEGASKGDTILVAPGLYLENLTLAKAVTLGSDYLLSNDTSVIRETIIDGQTRSVITITGPPDGFPRLVGLTIRNGDDGIMATSPFHLDRCRFEYCGDGIDYESGGGGSCKNSVFTKNLDDGIDLDGTLQYLHIDNNTITGNDDDGIEIRLHAYRGETSLCLITHNTIERNGEDGIQFIDYPDSSSRIYHIERNMILNNDMAGIGCMSDCDTEEDYRAAAIPEPIYLLNNTISGNTYGLTGGGGLISVNNLFIHSSISGVKRLTGRSVLGYSLFYNNGTDLEQVEIATDHLRYADPLLDESFDPLPGSPCIDGGTALLLNGGDTVLFFPGDGYRGLAPDIGAKESEEYTANSAVLHGILLEAFPNPFGEFLLVEPGMTEPGVKENYRLIDCRGVPVAEILTADRPVRLDTRKLPPGYYFLVGGSSDNFILPLIKN
jgi:hypothetical protein